LLEDFELFGMGENGYKGNDSGEDDLEGDLRLGGRYVDGEEEGFLVDLYEGPPSECGDGGMYKEDDSDIPQHVDFIIYKLKGK
jgi:hypothetical protein